MGVRNLGHLPWATRVLLNWINWKPQSVIPLSNFGEEDRSRCYIWVDHSNKGRHPFIVASRRDNCIGRHGVNTTHNGTQEELSAVLWAPTHGGISESAQMSKLTWMHSDIAIALSHHGTPKLLYECNDAFVIGIGPK